MPHKKIADAMKSAGIEDYDMLAVDYFMWDELLPLSENKTVASTLTAAGATEVSSSTDNAPVNKQSIHDEIKNKLVDIGAMLGFEAHTEVKISSGAIVDAVWEAKIGNMGKVI